MSARYRSQFESTSLQFATCSTAILTISKVRQLLKQGGTGSCTVQSCMDEASSPGQRQLKSMFPSPSKVEEEEAQHWLHGTEMSQTGVAYRGNRAHTAHQTGVGEVNHHKSGSCKEKTSTPQRMPLLKSLRPGCVKPLQPHLVC